MARSRRASCSRERSGLVLRGVADSRDNARCPGAPHRPSRGPMAETVRTTCCIAGGGPAGMMLGFLLARAGVNVVVLEKHRDFLRDFRGDTIHPSTLEVFHELGLVDALLALPHDEEQELTGNVFGRRVTLADFRHLPTVCKFLVLMPQWDFLN